MKPKRKKAKPTREYPTVGRVALFPEDRTEFDLATALKEAQQIQHAVSLLGTVLGRGVVLLEYSRLIVRLQDENRELKRMVSELSKRRRAR